MVPAVHLVLRSREPCPQSRKLSQAGPRHQPLDCDREYSETHLFGGCSAFCNCDFLRRALYLGYCFPSGQLPLPYPPATQNSPSTDCEVTSIPLVPAARIALTSFSLLALPVTKTRGKRSASKQTVNELAAVKFGITPTERSHGAVEGVSGDATNRLERGEPQEREDQGTRYDKGATLSTFRTTSTPTIKATGHIPRGQEHERCCSDQVSLRSCCMPLFYNNLTMFNMLTDTYTTCSSPSMRDPRARPKTSDTHHRPRLLKLRAAVDPAPRPTCPTAHHPLRPA